MLISSNHFLFLWRLHCVEITRVFKSKKLFVELLTFCHEWEAPGAIVTFFLWCSQNEEKREEISKPDCHLCNWITKALKEAWFRDTKPFWNTNKRNLRQSSTTHARVRVHCSTRIAGRRRVLALCSWTKISWRFWGRISAHPSSWHGESELPRTWTAKRIAAGAASSLHRTNRFRSVPPWTKTNKRINYSNIIISSPAPIVSAEFLCSNESNNNLKKKKKPRQQPPKKRRICRKIAAESVKSRVCVSLCTPPLNFDLAP